MPGDLHVEACDVARCRFTGLQRISCNASNHDDCGEDIWTGQWPGVAECEEYGLYARLIPGKTGWHPCKKDDEGAAPDLNTLFGNGSFEWSPKRGRWIKRETT